VTGIDETVALEPTTAELLARIQELTRRVEWLEASLGVGPHAPTDVPPDVVLAISAAVAAYLGKRATVRQIHLSGTTSWAQQGRAAVMASHGITHSPHGQR
jgi:methylmalonyl-CoA carboxyltransferase large subunit